MSPRKPIPEDPGGAAEAPPGLGLITVESLVDHSYDGILRPAGTTYDVDAAGADTLRALRFALPVAEVAAWRQP